MVPPPPHLLQSSRKSIDADQTVDRFADETMARMRRMGPALLDLVSNALHGIVRNLTGLHRGRIRSGIFRSRQTSLSRRLARSV